MASKDKMTESLRKWLQGAGLLSRSIDLLILNGYCAIDLFIVCNDNDIESIANDYGIPRIDKLKLKNAIRKHNNISNIPQRFTTKESTTDNIPINNMKNQNTNLQNAVIPSLLTQNDSISIPITQIFDKQTTDKNCLLHTQQIDKISPTSGKKRKFDECSDHKHDNNTDQPETKKLRLIFRLPKKNKQSLIENSKKNTTQMPIKSEFKCKKCPRTFTTNRGLSSHQRVHKKKISTPNNSNQQRKIPMEIMTNNTVNNTNNNVSPMSNMINKTAHTNINQPNYSNTSQSPVIKTENNNMLPFPSHMTLGEANRLKIHDKIDHRDKVGRFVYATILEKQGTNLKIHYDSWSDKYDIWSDFNLEIHRFAQAGSISKRPAHRFTQLKIDDCVNINPILKRPGWKSGKIIRFDQKSGQVQVEYTLDTKQYGYWVHLDNINEIAEYNSEHSEVTKSPKTTKKQIQSTNLTEIPQIYKNEINKISEYIQKHKQSMNYIINNRKMDGIINNKDKYMKHMPTGVGEQKNESKPDEVDDTVVNVYKKLLMMLLELDIIVLQDKSNKHISQQVKSSIYHELSIVFAYNQSNVPSKKEQYMFEDLLNWFTHDWYDCEHQIKDKKIIWRNLFLNTKKNRAKARFYGKVHKKRRAYGIPWDDIAYDIFVMICYGMEAAAINNMDIDTARDEQHLNLKELMSKYLVNSENGIQTSDIEKIYKEQQSKPFPTRNHCYSYLITQRIKEELQINNKTHKKSNINIRLAPSLISDQRNDLISQKQVINIKPQTQILNVYDNDQFNSNIKFNSNNNIDKSDDKPMFSLDGNENDTSTNDNNNNATQSILTRLERQIENNPIWNYSEMLNFDPDVILSLPTEIRNDIIPTEFQNDVNTYLSMYQSQIAEKDIQRR